MVPKRSETPFAELHQFLQSLGLTESRQGQFWSFEMPDRKTKLLYRPYRMDEPVTLLDLERTRRDLDSVGILEEAAFDDRLRKATA